MLVPVIQTTISMRDYARAALKAWRAIEGELPSKAAIAVLYAQYMIETGGKACWNWNIGNVKHVDGDGFDYIELHGVWEGVHPFVAARLFATGEAIQDVNPDHIKAVGPNKTPVIFVPPHPETWFRSYDSLDAAMVSHMRFLKGRFSLCWPEVTAGDYQGFAHALKAGRDGIENTNDDYFTAIAEAYAHGMSGPFFAFVNATTFDDELAAYLAMTGSIPPDVPTVPVDVPVIHPDVPLPGFPEPEVPTEAPTEPETPSEDKE